MPPPSDRSMRPAPQADPAAPRPDALSVAAPIGGFFGLDLADVASGPGGLDRFWGLDATTPAWCNATSALAALVAGLRPAAVWLPGYLCPEMRAAVAPSQQRFFPLTDTLSPQIAALDGHLSPGDMVLAVNMFGKPPGPHWQSFVAAHPDVFFVEDCAQALDPGQPPWGDWRLYSPRKLLGVPEGGFVIPVSARARAMAPLRGPSTPADLSGVLTRLTPLLARFEAAADPRNWHPLHQAAEASQSVSDQPMSRLARALIARHDPAPLIAARTRNFAHLGRRLAKQALLSDSEPAFAPFGFPVSLPPERRPAILAHLHAAGIFAAVHWPRIAAPADFADDHRRAASLITLPCDHRYGADDMDRVADAFETACAATA